MCKTNQNIEIDKSDAAPSKFCANCGAELKGEYCHECGQQIFNPNSSVKDMILEYLNNAYMWDTKLLQTLWPLVRKPGLLTNEYMSGKIIAYMHPLKLNMFLLFIFITMFVFFAGESKINDPINQITENEQVYSSIQINLLLSDKDYIAKMAASPRDTVEIIAPISLAEKHPEAIISFEAIETTETAEAIEDDENDPMQMGRYVIAMPRILIEDHIIIKGSDGIYHINTKTEVKSDDIELTFTIWKKMVGITSTYFPMIMLLTVPFIAFSLRLVTRKSKRRFLNHFIFALHYTALLELLIILSYALFLIFDLPANILQWIVIIGSCAYLIVAFRRVYEVNSWFRAVTKTLFTTLIYSLICLSIFLVILILTIVIVVSSQM